MCRLMTAVITLLSGLRLHAGEQSMSRANQAESSGEITILELIDFHLLEIGPHSSADILGVLAPLQRHSCVPIIGCCPQRLDCLQTAATVARDWAGLIFSFVSWLKSSFPADFLVFLTASFWNEHPIAGVLNTNLIDRDSRLLPTDEMTDNFTFSHCNKLIVICILCTPDICSLQRWLNFA